MDKGDAVHVDSGILHGHKKGMKTEPFVVMWVNPEPVIQSEISPKEKNRYHRYRIYMESGKNGTDEPICRAGIEAQT